MIIHKHLLELGRNVRTPINLTEGEGEQLIGNVRLRIHRDASVCGILAQSEYHTELGARSLISAVDTIKTLMVEAYLGVDEEITEGAGMSEFIIDVNGGEVVANIIPQSCGRNPPSIDYTSLLRNQSSTRLNVGVAFRRGVLDRDGEFGDLYLAWTGLLMVLDFASSYSAPQSGGGVLFLKRSLSC